VNRERVIQHPLYQVKILSNPGVPFSRHRLTPKTNMKMKINISTKANQPHAPSVSAINSLFAKTTDQGKRKNNFYFKQNKNQRQAHKSED
jgi:DNA-directed RNA polymerase subunit L